MRTGKRTSCGGLKLEELLGLLLVLACLGPSVATVGLSAHSGFSLHTHDIHSQYRQHVHYTPHRGTRMMHLKRVSATMKYLSGAIRCATQNRHDSKGTCAIHLQRVNVPSCTI